MCVGGGGGGGVKGEIHIFDLLYSNCHNGVRDDLLFLLYIDSITLEGNR